MRPGSLSPSPYIQKLRPGLGAAQPVAPGMDSAEERRWQSDANNGLRRIGVSLIVIYLFVRFSLISEILTFGFGFKPYLIIVIGPTTLLAALLSGGLRRAFRERPAWYMAGFMLWLLIVVPFSSWKGGSVGMLVPAFETEFTMFVLTAGLLFTLGDFARTSTAIVFGGLVTIIASRFYGVTEYGRFGLSFGSLANANDFATHLLLVVPFALMVLYRKASLAIRAVAIITFLGASLIIFQTGSRSGLLSLCLMSCFVLVKARGGVRVGMIAGLFVVGAVAAFTVPATTLHRYFTLFSSGGETSIDEAKSLEMAAGSGLQRKELLIDSIVLTINNPVFGVGPGQFAVQDAVRAHALGVAGKWLLTHNTYTEVSSETGFPGLILFVCTLASTFNSVRKVYNQSRRFPDLTEISGSALFLMMALAVFYVSIFFAAMSYKYYTPTMVGVVVSFVAAARHKIGRRVLEIQPAAMNTYRFRQPALSR